VIIQFHTPQGIVGVDSETVTDEELAALGMTREAFNELIGEPDYSRCKEILSHSPAAITMPEMWEVLRILAKRLGCEFD